MAPAPARKRIFSVTALDLARIQFGTTTIFHFFFVPVSIGLAFYVAVCQTLHYRTGKEVYARHVQFFGKLFLISFAVGVVTGIIQEFQFGMNWSEYSRFVGDIFGAPLAMEGLAAFFLESTFIGLWIFGKGRLSPRVHLMTIWLVSFGTGLSAWFIIAANSFMQHPVGYEMVDGKPKLNDIAAVLFSNTTLWAYAHVLFAALMTASLIALAVCAWQLRNGGDREMFSSAAKIALPMVCVGLLGSLVIGDGLMRDLVRNQPMKVAAAEALFDTEQPAAFSVFATGDFTANPGATNRNLKIPHVLSLLATHTWDGKVEGVNQINARYRAQYGPGEYAPVVAVIYWSFRVMVYSWGALLAFAAIGLLLWRKGKLETSRWWLKIAIFAGFAPFVINTAGWVMTEMGRQPWIVQGLLKTSDAVSPRVSTGQVLTSLIGFLVLFSVIGGIALWLFLREARHDVTPPPDDGSGSAPDAAPDETLSLAY
jgi:cytochrome d ubiquinol oxidase subunit I